MPVEAAPPPDADAQQSDIPESRFNLGFNLDTTFYKDKSFDLFSSSDAGQTGGIFVGYAVVSGVVSVVPEIGFTSGSDSSSGLFGGALTSTELDTMTYYGGVGLRWAALPYLEPEARIAAGAASLKMSFKPSSGPSELDENRVTPFGTLGAGLTLHTPPGWIRQRELRSVQIGLTIEGGYVVASSVTLDPKPAHDTSRIPTEDATLGTLERSAPYLRTALVFRF